MSTCTSKAVEPKTVRDDRRARIQTVITAALRRSPMTCKEIHRFAEHGSHLVPFRFVRYCGAACRGHLEDGIRWFPPSADDIRPVLASCEKSGRVVRVVMPGWQSHLWALTGRAVA